MENKTEVDLILNALHLFDVDSDPDAEVSRGCRSVTHEIDLNPPEPHFLENLQKLVAPTPPADEWESLLGRQTCEERMAGAFAAFCDKYPARDHTVEKEMFAELVKDALAAWRTHFIRKVLQEEKR